MREFVYLVERQEVEGPQGSHSSNIKSQAQKSNKAGSFPGRVGPGPCREAPPTPLSRPEWCLCRSAAVYGITSYNPASLLSYPVISNVEN